MSTAVLLIAFAAYAETPVTLEEVERSAVASNLTLQRSLAEVDAAEGRLLASRGTFDPVLGAGPSWGRSIKRGFLGGFPVESRNLDWNVGADLGGQTAFGSSYGVSLGLQRSFGRYQTDFGVGDTEATQDAYQGSLGATLRQPLLEGFGMAYTTRFVRQANAGLTRAELSAESQEQLTIAQAAIAYWAWAYAVEALGIANDAETTAKEALRVGGLREDAGTIAPIELVRLEASEVQARTQRVDAQHTVIRARNAVELVAGISLGPDATPASELGAAAHPIDEDDAIAAAIASNPDLLVLRALRDEASRALGDARHTLRPQLDATAATGLGTQEDTASDAMSSFVNGGAFPYIVLGADLSVPLGNRWARGGVDAATANLHVLELQVADLEQRIRAQVVEAVLAVQAATQKVELADANERLQTALLAAEEAKIAAGGSIEQDLLQVRTAHASARAEAFRTRTDLRLAEVELARLQGALTVP
jgi:outer membrane protein, heavy metal efflux system